VAALLACRASEVVFTSGGTEGDNLAVFGTAQAGNHIVTSTIEHHAVLNACKHLAALSSQTGCEVTYVPVDGRGLVDPSDVKRALRPNTTLISIMLANNETGVVQPVAEIAKIAAEAGVCFHTDAVQAAGKIALDVNQIGCNLLTISGHKFHGPQGVGALFVRKGTQLESMFYGGSHERSRLAGTENVPGIVGLGKAAELAIAGLKGDDISRMVAMRDRLERELLSIAGTGLNGVAINEKSAPRLPNTTNVYFDGMAGEALVIALDLKGLAVSTGAACSSGTLEPSHVLLAMGLAPERAQASIRFSLGQQNTSEDIDVALELVSETVAHMRHLSPLCHHAQVG
jgi:cysteine desulfurase